MSTYKTELPFTLIVPVSEARPAPESMGVVAARDVDWFALKTELGQATAVALDWETCGLDAFRPETRAVGLAIAWAGVTHTRWAVDEVWRHAESVYIDLSSASDPEYRQAVAVWDFLASERRRRSDLVVLAHNAAFDESICRMHARRLGAYHPLDGNGLTVTHCTYILYKQLASEGWAGQQWGLKEAMRDVLGWSDTNEGGIEDWLLGHGYHGRSVKPIEGETPEQHLARVREWERTPSKKGNPRPRVTPSKADMWRVPPEILGEYAQLDTHATLQLYCRVLHPLCVRFPELAEYHTERYLHLASLLIDQQYHGIRIDRPAMEAHGAALDATIAQADAEVRAHPAVSAFVTGWRDALLGELRATEPARLLKRRDGVEPKRLTKRGQESKAWGAWRARCDKPDVVSKNWIAWRDRMTAAESSPDYEFNLGSGDDLRVLLYSSADWPQWPGLIRWVEGTPADPSYDRPGTVWLDGRYGDVELERTDGGLLPADGDTIAQLADDSPRDALLRHHDALKERQFVTAYLDALHEHEDGWRIHAGWKLYGTLTGRLAGHKPSMHQLVKAHGFLRAFVADPGTTWFEKDWAALEPHVLAELSRDRGLLDLYGPDANPNHDRYLYEAAQFPGPVGEKVRLFYDVANPTAEGVELAKINCKTERQNAKGPILAMDYGAKARKIHRTMRSQGARITLEEVQGIVQAVERSHPGIYRDLGPRLAREWSNRGGWILSGLGFPNPVHESKIKDLINRCLGAGTEVRVRGRGWVRLPEVLPGEQVWDGCEWVHTDGPIYQGERLTQTLNGVIMTPDHDVLVKGEWRRADEVQGVYGLTQEIGPQFSWSDVWRLVCSIGHSLAQKCRLLLGS